MSTFPRFIYFICNENAILARNSSPIIYSADSLIIFIKDLSLTSQDLYICEQSAKMYLFLNLTIPLIISINKNRQQFLFKNICLNCANYLSQDQFESFNSSYSEYIVCKTFSSIKLDRFFQNINLQYSFAYLLNTDLIYSISLYNSVQLLLVVVDQFLNVAELFNNTMGFEVFFSSCRLIYFFYSFGLIGELYQQHAVQE